MSTTDNTTETTVGSSIPPKIIPINGHHNLPIKLTGANYSAWRAHLTALLNGLGLISHLNPANVLTSASPNYPHWFQQDQLLLAAILGSLSPEIHSLVAVSENTAHAWTTLAGTYASSSRSRVFQLKKDLSKIQLGSRSAAEFLQQIKAKVDELAVIDCRLSDDDVTFYVLDGLGPNYCELASFIQARDSSISFSELHDKVIAQETYLKQLELQNSNLVAT